MIDYSIKESFEDGQENKMNEIKNVLKN